MIVCSSMTWITYIFLFGNVNFSIEFLTERWIRYIKEKLKLYFINDDGKNKVKISSKLKKNQILSLFLCSGIIRKELENFRLHSKILDCK